jgi:hypothetical protein
MPWFCLFCPRLYDAAAAATISLEVQLEQSFYQSVAPVSEHATNPCEQGINCVTKLTPLVLLLPCASHVYTVCERHVRD